MSNYITNLPLNNIFGITACYKQVNTKLWSKHHKGIDFVGSSNIYSVCDGIVRVVGWDSKGWGRYVTVEPNGYPDIRFIFAHFEKNGVKVKVGDKVTRKTILGIMGSTGNVTGKHLHLEMRYKNTDVDVSKYLGIPNKVASNLNASNYKVSKDEADNYLKQLVGKSIAVCKDCNALKIENASLKKENTELKEIINNIKKFIEKWS